MTIPCDACHGKRFFTREICAKCDGAGWLVIPLPRLSFYKRNPRLSLFLIVLIGSIFVVLAAIAILS